MARRRVGLGARSQAFKRLLLRGGGAAPTFDLTATTTEAEQTVTLYCITPSGQDVTVDWGDGTESTIADGNTDIKSHEYAAAGEYTIRLPYVEYTTIEIEDSKVGGTVDADNPFPQVTEIVSLGELPGLTWTVNADNPFPQVTEIVSLWNLPGLTWTVDADNPFPQVTEIVSLWNLPGLTWTVDADNPFPQVTGYVSLVNLPGLTWASGAATNLHSVNTIIYLNSLSQAEVDAVLADLYSVFDERTKAGTIDLLGGGNAAPSGTSPGSAECPPTTGWNTAYELVNDSCDVSANHWAYVILET